MTLTGIYMTKTQEEKVLFNQMVRNHQEQDQRSKSSLQPDGQESPRTRPKEEQVLFNQMVRNHQDPDQQSFEMVVTYSMTQ